MNEFRGTHQNRLDAKGRISIPAPFRAVLRALASEDDAALVLRPSHRFPCVEGWPAPEFGALKTRLAGMDPFSDEYEDMAASIYADAYPVESDKEGRIVLPDSLASYAGLSDSVVFMGLGRTFQIWEPQAAERRRAEARERTRIRGSGAAA